jgi:putative ABC transport system substrate-binding protein
MAAGAALLWPLEGRAQKSPPIIGFLNSASPEAYTPMLAAFREVLREKGYEEGRNLLIEYRWAEGHYDRLPDMAAELVAGKVAVILASGSAAPALAAKAATTEIPVVFISGSDPVRTGRVASLNRPGGNLTGISITFTNLVPKRLELLSLLAPESVRLGALVNPNYPEVDFQKRELEEAAVAVHKPIEIVGAGTPIQIDTAFAGLATRGIGALLVGNDPFFVTRGEQFAALAAREKIPVIYSDRSYVGSGGLMSYGPSLAGAFRDAAEHVVRILNGAKPADLPVEQPTKFELVINLRTARRMQLNLPATLLLRADHVIE